MTQPKHHPTITRAAGRYRVACLCGWVTDNWANVMTAHLAFGRHLARDDTPDLRATARNPDDLEARL